MELWIRPVFANDPVNPERDEMKSGLPDGRRDEGSGDQGGGDLVT